MEEMKMKKSIKIIAALTLLVMVLALVLPGCGASKETVTAGKLTMGTNAEFPPYEFYDGGKVTGIDAEVAAAIAKKLNLELVIEDMDFDSLIPAVSTGKIDMVLAGLTVTEERQKTVNFSTSYAQGKQVIVVKEDSPITSVDDLFGDGNYTIGVQLATTGDLYTTWDIEDEGLGTIDRYNKYSDVIMALVDGKIDCVVMDNEPAKVYVSKNPGLKILETEYVVEDYAIALNKNNDKLYEKINKALGELIADGTIDGILAKYINAD
jgi:polar amino acid transport system substrate-binding protein